MLLLSRFVSSLYESFRNGCQNDPVVGHWALGIGQGGQGRQGGQGGQGGQGRIMTNKSCTDAIHRVSVSTN
ncbi:hypothetical protein NIES22_40740 [Calothrix brevissima NIES-22]|nr:hypothetical protein NIES22_40740 [Calothrix brevissima NIES-22]